MVGTAPELVEVARLIASGARRSGRIPVREMTRLQDSLVDDSGMVEYELDFGRDEDNRQMVHGHLVVTLSMRCQRCLEAVRVPLDCEFALECVWSEAQFPNVAPAHEPYLMSEQPVPLAGMIEDELILSLPLVARHQGSESCTAPAGAAKIQQADVPEKPHPLAELARLKRNRQNNGAD